jgi:hypothetical protein
VSINLEDKKSEHTYLCAYRTKLIHVHVTTSIIDFPAGHIMKGSSFRFE